MADIRALQRKRDSLKARLASFQNYLQGLNKKQNVVEADILELEQRLKRADDSLSEFDQIHNDILSLVDDDNVLENEEYREVFESSFFKVCAEARGMIALFRLTQNHGDDSSRVGSSHGSCRESDNIQHVKLPTLKLPQFDGSYDQWLSFYDTFKSVIHTNDSVSSIQKFHYLSSALVGDAAEVIRGLEISEINYEAAWKLLEKRYQNKPLMVHNHIKGIVDFPKLTKQCCLSLRNLLNSVQGHMRALEALGEPVSNWDSLLIYLISDKFDSWTRGEWEKQRVEKDDMPKIEEIIEFMERQCQLSEKINKQSKAANDQVRSQGTARIQSKRPISSHAATLKSACPLCDQPHPLFSCKTFLDMPVHARISEVKRHKRCLNCLRAGHIAVNCKSSGCRTCSKGHNSLLHIEASTNNQRLDNAEGKLSVNVTESTVSTHIKNYNHTVNVLPTALVNIFDQHGRAHKCTALLDSGSQSNFLSTQLSKKLGLPTTKININVSGIDSLESSISEKTTAVIGSEHSDMKATLSFLLMSNITTDLPSEPLDVSKLRIPENIALADPQFYKPKKIDMIIGVDLFWDLFSPDSQPSPYLHRTEFGYVISGRIPQHTRPGRTTACKLAAEIPSLSDQMRKFWEIEEYPEQKLFSVEESACESSFTQHTKRDVDGRFIVTIPLKGSLESLGDSKEQAERRFTALERKLQRDAKLRERYTDFMNQYESMGHMSRVDEKQPPIYSYYLPHHGVIKEDNITTKLRVVFDGSAPSTSGVSINDLHMVGPTIQPDLLTILLRFRQHPYVVGADISMMYRQVLLNPQQRDLQRILWRPNPNEPISIFRLNTVTYGLASSSFLAIRCLFQLAAEHEHSQPKAAEIIRENMYVDDLLFGASTIDEAMEIQKQVSHILELGSFQLRKWISNQPKILEEIELCDEGLSHQVMKLGETGITKTLGLSWTCTSDELVYSVSEKLDVKSCTKRSILSTIARIYDPLGLLGPCIIIAKIILQQAWLGKLSWDETLPSELYRKWKDFVQALSTLKELRVPRQVCCAFPVTVEIHAFSDASEAAYGACVYIRSIDSSGEVFVNLLAAKSRVAPLRSVTIPKLELCGAQVSSQLVEKVKASLNIPINSISYWCDSTIVLGWLKLQPSSLQTFVSNRVAEIQSKSRIEDWHYVRSQDNPADLISRGVRPNCLQEANLWWEGPRWLVSLELELPPSVEVTADLPELKVTKGTAAVSQLSTSIISFEKYSEMNKLERILAYCLRFINNLKVDKMQRKYQPITTQELQKARIHLIGLSQRQTFSEEMQELSKKNHLNRKSKLLKLNPFLHTDGTLRVGGRLGNSDFDFNKKHPIILSSQHHLTKLIFKQEHIKLLHVGPQTLLSCIRECYWPISGRNLARKTVHDCMICYKANPKSIAPIMGNLPRDRVKPAPPFYTTGVDYAGPFTIKDRKGRGAKSSKCYVALFVCFVTRGIHLELVSDLTSECFILALRRFASRWGMPGTLYSDNGTSFVGAHSELRELGNFLMENQNLLDNYLAKQRFNWKFIPAYSPHFGGLWEAGVKSTKYHLRRVIGKSLLTFEELYSLLAQISAILNSRPLTPLSSDPCDLHPLTPAHFLIGRSFTSVPDPDVTHLSESHASRYQRIQQIQQNFWKRWSKEYISELQCRTKWKTSHDSLQEGALVLVKDDNLPPLKWQLGRVTELHPGSDFVVRVASLRTNKGIIKRAVTKLCPLPLETSN